MTKTLCSNCWK